MGAPKGPPGTPQHTLRVIILAFLQEKLEITGPEGPYLGLRPAFL